MTDHIQNIPLNEIDTTTLPRDRTIIDADAQQELQTSIAQNGLRLPIEVYPIKTGYGLISGYRRLTAIQTLSETTKDSKYTTITALIRTPKNRQEALAAMVEENEVRQNLSPWERARIIITAHDAGIFDSITTALTTLYPQISRQKRSKLRAITEVIEVLDGHLIDPEQLTQNQLIRLANILRLDWGKIIIAAIDEQNDLSSTTQWNRLLPIIQEAETRLSENRSTAPNRPHRLSTPKNGINIRRECTPNGYLLHITGKHATDMLITSVLDQIELWLGEE